MSVRRFFHLLLMSCTLMLSPGANSESLSLSDGFLKEPGATIESSVVTEHGRPYVLAKLSDGSYLVRRCKAGMLSLRVKQGAVVSNLVALNNGTLNKTGYKMDTLALFTFQAEDGHQLHLFEFVTNPDDDFTEAFSLSKKVNVSGCASVNHVGLSAGFRGRVFFASDCLFGEFDFALGDGGRIRWFESNYQTTYAAFPPAVDYHGRGHFLVRNGAHIQVLRSYVSGKYETLASFNDFLPPEADASLASYPFSGLSVMADGTVLFSGGNKLKRLAKDMKIHLNLGDNQLWGPYGAISSYDAIYFAEVDSATRSSLNIRKIPFDRSGRADGTHHFQTELNADSRIYPGSLGLVNDGRGNKVVYIANGKLFAQDIDHLNNSPQQLDILPAMSGSSSQNLENPPNLLLAGKEAYIKGRTLSGAETYEQLYRMFFTSGKNAPFSRNIRGVWAQPGADQQGSYGVSAGVEVLLDQSVSRAALSCHLISDEENSFLVPASGVFLRSRSKLLSIYHHELTADHLVQFQAGVECQPYQVELVPQKPESVSGDGIISSVLAATNALGDSFQLQLVAQQTLAGAGFESVPLWATSQPQINGALSSEVTVTTEGCVNHKSACSGYRRLAIGGDPEQMRDNKPTNIIVTALLGTSLVILLVALGITIWDEARKAPKSANGGWKN